MASTETPGGTMDYRTIHKLPYATSLHHNKARTNGLHEELTVENIPTAKPSQIGRKFPQSSRPTVTSWNYKTGQRTGDKGRPTQDHTCYEEEPMAEDITTQLQRYRNRPYGMRRTRSEQLAPTGNRTSDSSQPRRSVMKRNFGINFWKKKRYARTRKTYQLLAIAVTRKPAALQSKQIQRFSSLLYLFIGNYSLTDLQLFHRF